MIRDDVYKCNIYVSLVPVRREILLSDFDASYFPWMSLFPCKNSSPQRVCYLHPLNSFLWNSTKMFFQGNRAMWEARFFSTLDLHFSTFFKISNHFSITDPQNVREVPSSKGNKSRLDNFLSNSLWLCVWYF